MTKEFNIITDHPTKVVWKQIVESCIEKLSGFDYYPIPITGDNQNLSFFCRESDCAYEREKQFEKLFLSDQSFQLSSFSNYFTKCHTFEISTRNVGLEKYLADEEIKIGGWSDRKFRKLYGDFPCRWYVNCAAETMMTRCLAFAMMKVGQMHCMMLGMPQIKDFIELTDPIYGGNLGKMRKQTADEIFKACYMVVKTVQNHLGFDIDQRLKDIASNDDWFWKVNYLISPSCTTGGTVNPWVQSNAVIG